MDPIFAAVIITALVAIIALVAITYRQKDIAALALRVLSQTAKPIGEAQTKPQPKQGEVTTKGNGSG
jgi:hypothetical protein